MAIASLTVRLLIRASRSLKDKRQVVRSILDRVKGGFNVSAAEIDSHDDVKLATLGFVAVAAEAAIVTILWRSDFWSGARLPGRYGRSSNTTTER